MEVHEEIPFLIEKINDFAFTPRLSRITHTSCNQQHMVIIGASTHPFIAKFGTSIEPSSLPSIEHNRELHQREVSAQKKKREEDMKKQEEDVKHEENPKGDGQEAKDQEDARPEGN